MEILGAQNSPENFVMLRTSMDSNDFFSGFGNHHINTISMCFWIKSRFFGVKNRENNSKKYVWNEKCFRLFL